MKIIGHRGARGLSPENTLASFEKAIQYGVDAVELDVRVTRDGVAVVHHDAAVINPDGSEVIIARTTYAELLRHKRDLAALDHTIRAVSHRCSIMIEIKPGEPTKQTVRIIRDRLKRGWRLKEFAVASYDFRILQDVREQLPGIELVVIEKWSGLRATHRARKLHTKRISMNQRWLWRGFLHAMRRSGFRLSPYTINNPRQAKRWQPYLYGVITDRPDLFQ
jgi:glycerophosphoryl diester phosphodiesterase